MVRWSIDGARWDFHQKPRKSVIWKTFLEFRQLFSISRGLAMSFSTAWIVEMVISFADIKYPRLVISNSCRTYLIHVEELAVK